MNGEATITSYEQLMKQSESCNRFAEWLDFEDEYLRTSKDPLWVIAQRLGRDPRHVARRRRKLAQQEWPTDEQILSACRYGDTERLAKQFGVSATAIRARRCRLRKERGREQGPDPRQVP